MVGRIVGIVVLIALTSPGAWGQDTSSAERFLRNLYLPYTKGKAPNPTGTLAPLLFEPALLALIRRDQALANGEIGKLDHDPICSCQDYDALTALSISVDLESNTLARAKVSFINGSEHVVVQFQLATVFGNWRICDIQERHLASLRKLLEAGAARWSERGTLRSHCRSPV